MVVRIKVSGFENENVEKLTLKEEKSGLLSVKRHKALENGNYV